MNRQTWTCACGEVSADVRPARRSRLVCYCRYCRGMMRHFGLEEALDASGGCELVMTLPEWVRVTRGRDRMQVLRLSRRGAIRWYAACCGSPMVNTHPNRSFPYASVYVRGLDDASALGPVAMRAFPEQATAPVADASKVAFYTVTARAIGRAVRARLGPAYLDTPFFAPDGTLPQAPERLDDARRRDVLGLSAKGD